MHGEGVVRRPRQAEKGRKSRGNPCFLPDRPVIRAYACRFPDLQPFAE